MTSLARKTAEVTAFPARSRVMGLVDTTSVKPRTRRVWSSLTSTGFLRWDTYNWFNWLLLKSERLLEKLSRSLHWAAWQVWREVRGRAVRGRGGRLRGPGAGQDRGGEGAGPLPGQELRGRVCGGGPAVQQLLRPQQPVLLEPRHHPVSLSQGKIRNGMWIFWSKRCPK